MTDIEERQMKRKRQEREQQIHNKLKPTRVITFQRKE